jgi:hypothetical protein
MISTTTISRLFRGVEIGKLGKFLFVGGAGLLSFSSVCLLRSSDPFVEFQEPALVLFGLAAVIVIAGETIRAMARSREQRFSPSFMDRLQRIHQTSTAASPRAVDKRADVRCAFCGKNVVGTGLHKADEAEAENQFGRCLNCGKTACPRCSYLKGMEMGRKSLRCPACGGPVY